MSLLVLILVSLARPIVADSARLVGSTLVVESVGLEIALPPVWFGAKDTVKGLSNCGHDLRGSVNRRFATSGTMLDSLRNAQGEWDREYSAVTDSVLPFAHLVAQVGPEPFGAGGQCFGDLQMRVYVFPDGRKLSEQAKAIGLRTARGFFSSAALVSQESAPWHFDRLHWSAWYYDYGAEANLEMFSTIVRGKTVVLVFMRAGGDVTVGGVIGGSLSSENGPAERDEQFILEHVRFR
jgi:hypothetical protein